MARANFSSFETVADWLSESKDYYSNFGWLCLTGDFYILDQYLLEALRNV